MISGRYELESQKQNKSGRTNTHAPLPDDYHLTELGPLPGGWRVMRFDQIFKGKPRGVQIPQAKKAQLKETGMYPVIGQGQELVEGYVDNESLLFPRNLVPVLIFGPHTRRVKLVEKWPFVSGPNVRYIWPTDEMDIRFAYFSALHANIPSRGYNDHFPLFKQNKFVCPPLPEQRAIAHVLRTVQRAKEATERVIAALRELKKSLMRHLFTYGPVPVGETDRVPLQESEIGPIPTHWRVVRFNQMFREKPRGARIPQAKKSHVKSIGAYPVIGQGKSFIEGYTDDKSLLFPKNLVPVVIFGPHTRRIKLVEKWPFVSGPNVRYLWPNDGVDITFAYFAAIYVDIPSRGYNDHFPLFKQCKFVCPPLPEQREIACILQAVDGRIEAEEARRQALESLFRSLLHHLMTARIRLPAGYVRKFEGGEQ